MRLVFVVATVVTIALVAKQRQPLSMRSLFALSAIVYGWPVLAGRARFIEFFRDGIPSYHDQALLPTTVVLYLLPQLISWPALLGPPSRAHIPASVERSAARLLPATLALTIGYLVTTLLLTGPDILIGSKLARIASLPVTFQFTELTASALMVLLAVGWRYASHWWLAPIVVLIGIDLALGYRTLLVLGGLAAALAFGATQPLMIVRHRAAVGLLAVVAIVMSFVYKPVYFAVSSGTLGKRGVAATFTSAFQDSEPPLVMATTNAIVRDGVAVPKDYAFNAAVLFTPGYEQLSSHPRLTFNGVFQPELFPRTNFGLASTSLGELFSTVGLFGVIVYLAFLGFLSWRGIRGGTAGITIRAVMAPYLLFLMYRSDALAPIGTLRLLLLALMPLGVGALFMTATAGRFGRVRPLQEREQGSMPTTA